MPNTICRNCHATDIQGGHVVQVLLTRGVSRQEVTVREIMTARDHLEAIDMHEVRGAKVGHVLSTLKQAGRQHAIVVDVEVYRPTFHEQLTTQRQPGVMQTVRGLFSATQIARQLGLHPQPGEIATTFAESRRSSRIDAPLIRAGESIPCGARARHVTVAVRTGLLRRQPAAIRWFPSLALPDVDPARMLSRYAVSAN
jgi:hypothetical protein